MIVERYSPHRNARPAGTAIDAVVLHADASPSEHSTLDWLADRRAGVSYHWLVGRTGTLYAVVLERDRAWHAGRSWFGRPNCNDFSIGVAFANCNDGRERISDAQWDAAVQLVAGICRRWSIPTHRIVTHRDIAVPQGRKNDPHPAVFSRDLFRKAVQAVIA